MPGIEDKWFALVCRLFLGGARLKGVLVSPFPIKLGTTGLGLCFPATNNNPTKT
jgi:hypothetical protein